MGKSQSPPLHPQRPAPDGDPLAEEHPGDSPEGLVLGADVESDGPAPDVEGVDAVVLHHHLCILLGAQLHKRLGRVGAVEIHNGLKRANNTLTPY